MGTSWAKNLGPQNTYAIVTILSFIATMPVVLALDLPVLPKILDNLKVRQQQQHPDGRREPCHPVPVSASAPGGGLQARADGL